MEEVAERFLSEDLSRAGGGMSPDDRARFHRLVRQCAANWLLHPQAGLKTSRTKHTATLAFEGPLGGRPVPLFLLRAHYDEDCYRFIGPNAERRKLDLQPKNLLALDRLHELYDALLSGKEPMKDAVCAVLRGDRLPDLVPLVEETRRALDGGQETSPPLPSSSKNSARSASSSSGARPAGAPPRSSAPSKAPARVGATATAGTISARSTPAAPHKGAASHRSPAAAPPSDAKKPPTPVTKQGVTVSHLLLTCLDVRKSSEFYAKLFGLKPERSPEDKRTYDVEVGPLKLRLKPDFDKDERKRLGLGQPPKFRGFGMMLTLRVADHAACHKRAKAMKRLVEGGTEGAAFYVKDPSGYLLEVLPSA